ncbi:SLC13 family permease [Gordonia sp. OPL2]|uniref:SLC13 family permease n=1 Tax=Gordonia sp. OPL2 TaxID=2486274 RepID=UPI001654C4C1|nr:SLC13 family permease [Gordonia sp. OPL2]RPA02525.1 arsenic transporter [Gordonia sp. OPL2]
MSASGVVGSIIAVALLVIVIIATVGARRIPAALVAVPVAVLVVLLGLTDLDDALDEIWFMAPTIGFLAAMLVVADVCARTGVFTWIGTVLAGWSRSSPNRLLRIVFLVAAATTAVLSIDTTIVLLTPVAVATARRVGARIAPVAYASNHLANSASTLFPVSNLTNLLAFGATGLTFLGFTGLMAAPWVVAIVVEYLIFRWFFADALAAPSPRRGDGDGAECADSSRTAPEVPAPHTPRAVLIALGLLLVAFVVAEPLGIPLAAVAGIGALIMVTPLLFRAPAETLAHTVRAINVPFLAFVAALGVIILPVRQGPLGDAVSSLIPSGTGLFALLGVAALAAVLANLLNNLPATLLLVPLVAHQPALVLAVLLGVNIGPNLAYFGSLANLLWRDVMHRQSAHPASRQYLMLGALTVPPTLAAAVVALWAGLSIS